MKLRYWFPVVIVVLALEAWWRVALLEALERRRW